MESEIKNPENNNAKNQLDMTPMVDVTFLLLIFFMVTASFSVQKSIVQNQLPTDLPGLKAEFEIDSPQYVEVFVDQFNTYQLTSSDSDRVEAPSDQEMRVRLRDMIQSTNAKQLRITAHGDSWHEKVVSAWDAGVGNDIHDVRIRMGVDWN